MMQRDPSNLVKEVTMGGAVVRVAAGVMVVMGVFLLVVGLAFGEWGRVAQGGLFVVLGVYFWRWRRQGKGG